MDKLRMTSPDLTAANVEKIAELFPSVVTESRDKDGNLHRAIDFDLLRQELSPEIVEGPQERYQLDWPGKRAALFAANAPIAKTLRPDRAESVDFDTTKNLFIEGDNLDVLKLLQESYLGKVKLIYIDPPYNTGNDFVYNDDFAESTEEYLARSGQVDESGSRLTANPESRGRYHSDWLNMMYPRLRLARKLLTDDGVIFMSIDDNEMANLMRVASEVFGEANFVGSMVWAAGRKNDSKYISTSHEYILCFARSLTVLAEKGVRWRVRKKGLEAIYTEAKRLVAAHDSDYEAASKGLRAWYNALPDSDEAKRSKHYSRIDARGVYFPSDISWPGGGGPEYDLLHPVTKRPVRIPSRGWLFQENVMLQHVRAGNVQFGEDEDSVPTFKRYLKDTEYEVQYSVFYQDGRAATKRLRTLMEGTYFDFPKDETILQSLIAMATSSDDLVMDFFAGSGTTAHAVMAQNAEDGGGRRFILVQLDEQMDRVAKGAAYGSIAAVARERVRRAGQAIRAEAGLAGESLDTGFRTLRLDTSNRNDLFRTPEESDQASLDSLEGSIKADRTAEDLVFQVLLEWGLDISLPVATEVIAGHNVYIIDDGVLMACLENSVSSELIEQIARRQPLRAVFLDSGFQDDAARINAEQIFRELSPSTDIKVI